MSDLREHVRRNLHVNACTPDTCRCEELTHVVMAAVQPEMDAQAGRAKKAERNLRQTRIAISALAKRWLGPDFQRAYGDSLLAVMENPEGYLKLMDAPQEAE